MSSNDPNMDHLTTQHFEKVYEPADDTWLFADALEKDVSNLLQLNPLVCCEMGVC